MKFHRVILWVTLALALGWSAVWMTSAWRLHGEIEGWFEARRAEGWQADFANLKVRGFPSRLDVTLTDVRLLDPVRGTGWSGPFFQILGLTYKPGHWILVWPEQQVLTLPTGPVTIEGSGLGASVVHDAEGVVLRFNFEAETLNLDIPDRAIALAGLRVALLDVPGVPDLYRLGLSAQGLAGLRAALLPGSDSGEALQVQAEIAFDKPWTTGVLAADRPQPRQIDLRMADYRFEGLELNLGGRLTVDDRGRATGEMPLRAANWREMLAQAREAGQIGDALADTLEAGLGLAAELGGRGDRLELPFRVEEGRMSLGVIPLGNAPRMAIP